MERKSIELTVNLYFDSMSQKHVARYFYNDTGKEVEDEITRALNKEQKKRLDMEGEKIVKQLIGYLENKQYKSFVRMLKNEVENSALRICDNRIFDILVDKFDLLPINSVSDFQKNSVAEILLDLASRCHRYDKVLTWLDYMEGTITNTRDECAGRYGKDDILLAKGNAYGFLGKKQTAICYYKSVMELDTSYMHLAYAYRGMTSILGISSPEASYYEGKAADYFLLSGNVEEYVRSIIYLSTIYERCNPEKAMSLLKKGVTHLDKNSYFHKELEGKLLSKLAKIKANQGDIVSAVNVGTSATKAYISSRIAGNELTIIDSVKFLEFFVEDPNNTLFSGICDVCETVLSDDEKRTKDLKNSIIRILINEDKSEWSKVENDLEASSNPFYKTLFWIGKLCVNMDNLRLEEKLIYLDNAWNSAGLIEINFDLQTNVANIFAHVYFSSGDRVSAIKWCEKALELSPFNTNSRRFYIEVLLESEEWNKLLKFVDKEISICGEVPYMVYYKGIANLNLGNAKEAFFLLSKAKQEDKNLPSIDELIEMALKKADVSGIESHNMINQTVDIDLNAFDDAISEFATYIQSDRRKDFWRLEDNKHKWINRPEKHAQELLHTFLKAKFHDNLEALEETGAGAGRIDLYLIFKSGFRMVVELKMCGNGYTSSYAESGIKQAIHYSKNKRLKLAYLIVFDSRTSEYGVGLENYHDDEIVVRTKVVDVRATVK